MPKKIIYIAGKMRGLPDYGRGKFSAAEDYLKSLGYIVLNPACLPIGMNDDKYLPICIQMINAADSVYMLNNWGDSQGAMVEHYFAEAQGKEISYEPEESN